MLAAIQEMDKDGDVTEELILRALIWLAQITDQHATITRNVNWDTKHHGRPPRRTIGTDFNPFLRMGMDAEPEIEDLNEHFGRLAESAFGFPRELVQV